MNQDYKGSVRVESVSDYQKQIQQLRTGMRIPQENQLVLQQREIGKALEMLAVDEYMQRTIHFPYGHPATTITVECELKEEKQILTLETDMRIAIEKRTTKPGTLGTWYSSLVCIAAVLGDPKKYQLPETALITLIYQEEARILSRGIIRRFNTTQTIKH